MKITTTILLLHVHSSCSVSILLFLIGAFHRAEANLKFCLRGKQAVMTDLETSRGGWHCPGGLLFSRPTPLKAVTTESNTFCVKRSICDDNWECGYTKQSVMAQVVKVGKPSGSGNYTWKLIRNENIEMHIPECSPNGLFSPDQRMSSRMHRKKRQVMGLVPSERTSQDELQEEIDDQTKRMFYYLAGINQEQVNSHLRVVKLFQMSSQLVTMICDPQFLRPPFIQEIERAFLFLLKEQGFDNLIDMDPESYTLLKQSLEHCATNVQMVKFLGKACPTETKVETVYRMDDGRIRSIEYTRGEKTFKWGEYDLVMDAAWAIVDIVHGGCFESFTANLNLHHKFQVALEQLFHAALYLRWENPTQLGDDLFYDSIFLAKVNSTMEVMDACARFLYLFTPFRVQLNRPIHENIYQRRRKRSLDKPYDDERVFSSQEKFAEEYGESHSDNEIKNGISSSSPNLLASCLQSDAELKRDTRIMRGLHCNNL